MRTGLGYYINDAPLDPINGLDQMFRDDRSPSKANLVVGVYQDENGESPVLAVVKEAERRLLEIEASKSYLPVPGEQAYRQQVERLLFGDAHSVIGDSRASSIHTPGGTAALRIAADFVMDHSPKSRIWISDPAYPNHIGIFGSSGFELKSYRYYDTAAGVLTFESMLSDLAAADPGDVVVLHACCHNPSGADLDPEQWKQVGELVAGKQLYPLIDFAYLGFGESLDADASGLRRFFDHVPCGMVSTSFSKNFALYGERTGMLTFVGADPDLAERAVSRSKVYIRRLYSSPPAHGSRVVATVLGDQDLTRKWISEVDEMRRRLARIRKLLSEKLQDRQISRAWFPSLTENRGMFALTRIDEDKVHRLQNDFHVYMLPSGRISIAGIREANVDWLADSFSAVIGAGQEPA